MPGTVSCRVKVEDALALYERLGADRVVAGWQRRDLDLGSEFRMRVGDAALALVDVDDDLRRCRLRASHRRHSCRRVCEPRPRPHSLRRSRLNPAAKRRTPAAGHGTMTDVKFRELIRQLEADRWRLVAQRGSHQQYEHPTKPGKVTVAGKPNADVPKGTAANILRQAGLRRPNR
jgi:predicted RNA binding protein YcfA (HicA-like mRNA interferase family)